MIPACITLLGVLSFSLYNRHCHNRERHLDDLDRALVRAAIERVNR